MMIFSRSGFYERTAPNRVLLRLGREKLLLLCSMSREGEAKALESLGPCFLKDQAKVLRLEPFTREETDELIRKTLPELVSRRKKRRRFTELQMETHFFCGSF